MMLRVEVRYNRWMRRCILITNVHSVCGAFNLAALCIVYVMENRIKQRSMLYWLLLLLIINIPRLHLRLLRSGIIFSFMRELFQIHLLSSYISAENNLTLLKSVFYLNDIIGLIHLKRTNITTILIIHCDHALIWILGYNWD